MVIDDQGQEPGPRHRPFRPAPGVGPIARPRGAPAADGQPESAEDG